jgi:hypothetical protein
MKHILPLLFCRSETTIDQQDEDNLVDWDAHDQSEIRVGFD